MIGLLTRVREYGNAFGAMLRERFEDHPHIGDIRGRGLFWGELADRTTKTPFDPKPKLHARIKREAMARGLLVYPMGGTVDGQRGDHVLLAPPFIATEDQLATITARLHQAIDAAIATV